MQIKTTLTTYIVAVIISLGFVGVLSVTEVQAQSYGSYGSFGDTGYAYGSSYGSYGSIGDAGYSYYTPSYSSYGSFGTANAGCCDTYNYGSYGSIGDAGYAYDYGSSYDSYGSIGDAGYVYDYGSSYGSYGSIGDAGYVYDYGSSYGSYGSIGDAGYVYDYSTTQLAYADTTSNSQNYIDTYNTVATDYYASTGYNYIPSSFDYGYNYSYTPYNYGYSSGGYNGGYTYTPSFRGDPAGCRAFTADEYRVHEGDYVTLRWDTTEAEDVDINNNVGDVAVDGTTRVRVYRDTTFTLVARNNYGSDICRLTIEVIEDDGPTRDDDVSCDAFTASDTRVDEGDYVTLRWRTTDADSVVINNGVGSVADDGEKRIRVYDDTTYTLTARNGNDTDTCRVTVNVDDDRTSPSNPARCDSFTASDTRVDEGDYVTLRWRTTNAHDVSINNGVGDVDDDGDKRVRVYRDTTFKLTAENSRSTETCNVTVRVDEDRDSRSSDKLQCRLTISDTAIVAGQAVTLSWDNDSADRAILKDNHGNEIFDTRDDSRVDEDRDAIVLQPTRSTDYTLTVYDGSKRETCEVGTDITAPVGGIRLQGGINLGQVPYTGFEAGPVLTFIFYAAVVLWGVVIAYVLVMRKRALATVSTTHIPVATSVSEAPHVASVVDTVPFNLPTMKSEATMTQMSSRDALRALEIYAHEKYALFSSDALSYIATLGTTEELQTAILSDVIARAKAQFPKEGDWIVINKERVLSVLG